MGATTDELFYKGAGCDACKHRGVKGRHAVYELLVMSPTIKAMVTPHAEAIDIQKLAIEEGMTPLTEHALHLARKKIISLAKSIENIEMIEASISPFDLQKAEELFITNI